MNPGMWMPDSSWKICNPNWAKNARIGANPPPADLLLAIRA
jgi:hypothetical protein